MGADIRKNKKTEPERNLVPRESVLNCYVCVLGADYSLGQGAPGWGTVLY